VQVCNITVLRKDKHGQFSDCSFLPDLKKKNNKKLSGLNIRNVLYKIKMFEIESRCLF